MTWDDHDDEDYETTEYDDENDDREEDEIEYSDQFEYESQDEFYSVDDYTNYLYWLARSTVITIVGIALLIAEPFLKLGLWASILGILCVGIGGPLVLYHLSGDTRGPVRELVLYLGLALPGIASTSLALLVRRSVTLATDAARKGWSLVLIIGLVWLGSFILVGLLQYSRARRDFYGWHSAGSRRSGISSGWSSYEWMSLIVAMVGTAASVAAIFH
jgi:hypothetical protein